MGVTVRECWECDECGYVWLKVEGRQPVQCANGKCRSRRWNGAQVPGEVAKRERREHGPRLSDIARTVEKVEKPLKRRATLAQDRRSDNRTTHSTPETTVPNWDLAYERIRQAKGK